MNALPLLDAARQQATALDRLSDFLAAEIARIDANLAPCRCGHAAMFCACNDENVISFGQRKVLRELPTYLKAGRL